MDKTHETGHLLGRSFTASFGVVTMRWCHTCEAHITWPAEPISRAVHWPRTEPETRDLRGFLSL
jgi:hypothetical protein